MSVTNWGGRIDKIMNKLRKKRLEENMVILLRPITPKMWKKFRILYL